MTSKENAWVLYFAGLLEEVFRSGRDERLKCYDEALSEMEASHEWRSFGVEMDLLRQGELKSATSVRSVRSVRHECLRRLRETMPVLETVLCDIGKVSDAALSSRDFHEARGCGVFVDNPIFEGSDWVGGADGDFLFGRTLWDVKTTIRPENLWDSAIRQLVSYVALDAGDLYHIEELAVFLPRQHGLVVKVALGEVLEHSAFSSRKKMQLSARQALGG